MIHPQLYIQSLIVDILGLLQLPPLRRLLLLDVPLPLSRSTSAFDGKWVRESFEERLAGLAVVGITHIDS